MNRPISVEDLAPRLPAKGRLIGLDLGAKTIGLALSDVERRLASPLKTLARGAFQKDADALIAIFAEFEIAGVILGLPLDLEGRDGPPRAIDARFRPQPRDADGLADRLLGRALLHRRRHPIVDRKTTCPAQGAPGSSTRWRRLTSCRARWTGWRASRAAKSIS